MRLGILVEVEEGLDWEQWRATYTTAERLGFDSVWLSDHLQSPWPDRPHGLETWTALTVAAAETQRIELGPLVSPITLCPCEVNAPETFGPLDAVLPETIVLRALIVPLL